MLPLHLHIRDLVAGPHEVGERREAEHLLVEGRVDPPHLRLHGGGVQPLVVVFRMPELERAHQQPGGGLVAQLRASAGGDLLGELRGHIRDGCRLRLVVAAFGDRVIQLELITGRNQRGTRAARHSDADDEAPEPLAALCERDVVGVAGHDHHMGEVRQPEQVLQHIDREPDVCAVLEGLRRREQLGEVDGAIDQLVPIAGVGRHGPVRVRPGDRHRAERRCVVEHRSHIDRRLAELRRDGPRVGGAFQARVVVAPGAPPVDLVVPRDDDVVEVDVDGDARVVGNCHGASLAHVASTPPITRTRHDSHATPQVST